MEVNSVDFHLDFIGNVFEFLFSVFWGDNIITKFIGKHGRELFGVIFRDRNSPENFHIRSDSFDFLQLLEGISSGVFHTLLSSEENVLLFLDWVGVDHRARRYT